MSLIRKLQECNSISEAKPILQQIRAGPAVKKLVETAMILKNSPDPQQQDHSYGFMDSAVKELERGVMDNHNNGPREDGSSGSTYNEQNFPNPARTTQNGEKPMQDMSGTQNQWSPRQYAQIQEMVKTAINYYHREYVNPYIKSLMETANKQARRINRMSESSKLPKFTELDLGNEYAQKITRMSNINEDFALIRESLKTGKRDKLTNQQKQDEVVLLDKAITIHNHEKEAEKKLGGMYG